MQYKRNELIRLDNARNREIFARVTVLDKYERPIEAIEGKITGSGSINIDGNSAVRRTVSLSMVAQDVKIHNVYWGLTSKVKIEVGIRNMDDGNTSQIYWFKAGIYVLTEFRTQQSLNNLTISLSGKDKMCLLNGEVGGHFMADTDLGTIDEVVDEDIVSNKALKISTIIREMLVGIGGELPQNIILNNVDDYAIEMLNYIGDSTLYVLFDINANAAVLYFEGKYLLPDNYYLLDGTVIDKFDTYEDYVPYLSTLGTNLAQSPFIITDDDNKSFAVYKADRNQACGYRLTELTYPGGELIARAGETITSVLDKIKNQFGTFEYFYDIDGHFVFQVKQIYTNNSYNTRTDYTLMDTESYIENSFDFSKYSYYFNNNNLVTSLNNSPQLSSLKNDYAIWGENVNGLSIHLRYAIDEKPYIYHSLLDGTVYEANELTGENYDAVVNYNQEIEYKKEEIKVKQTEIKEHQDAIEYYLEQFNNGDITEEEYQAHYDEESLLILDLENDISNLQEDIVNIKLEKAQIINTHADWRELIYRMALDWFKYYHNGGMTDAGDGSGITADNFIQKLQEANPENEYLRVYGKTGYEQYYTDLEGFWRYLYNPYDNDDEHDPVSGYNYLIEKDPAALLFYFDFLDGGISEVGAYSVSNIGDRTKVYNNNAIKVIKYEEVPNIIFNFVEGDDEIDYESESAKRIAERYYDIYYSTNDINMFDIAARGKSCYDELDNLLYNCTYINQSVSLTALPIYYLEPNTLIYIKDETNDINGEFAINRMTIPLTYNGTMSITANKVPQRLY